MSTSSELCPKKFQQTFDAYFLKWNIGVGILYVVAFSLFFVPLFVRATNSELPSLALSIVNFGSYPGMGESTFGFITIGINIRWGGGGWRSRHRGMLRRCHRVGCWFHRHLRRWCVFCWRFRVRRQRFRCSRAWGRYALWGNRQVVCAKRAIRHWSRPLAWSPWGLQPPVCTHCLMPGKADICSHPTAKIRKLSRCLHVGCQDSARRYLPRLMASKVFRLDCGNP